MILSLTIHYLNRLQEKIDRSYFSIYVRAKKKKEKNNTPCYTKERKQ